MATVTLSLEEYEAMRKRPLINQRIGGPGRGAKGHSHPHPGRSGSHSGTWVSQDKFESEFGVAKAKIIPVTPKEQKDLPSDIMLDFKSGYYHSPKENVYYDNDAVERILEL